MADATAATADSWPWDCTDDSQCSPRFVPPVCRNSADSVLQCLFRNRIIWISSGATKFEPSVPTIWKVQGVCTDIRVLLGKSFLF